MLATKFLVALCSLSPLAMAQVLEGSYTKTANGAAISNTGQGGGTGNISWATTSFLAPSSDIYWVLEEQNTAMWNPVNETVNLVIFNSNSSLWTGNSTIAENVAPGTGSWKGKISGFTAGNHYILTLQLANNKDVKIAQTDGFWIKRNGYVAADLPSAAAGAATATGDVAGGAGASTGAPSGTTAPSGTVPGGAAAASSSTAAAGAATTPKSAAGALTASAGAVVVAAAFALAL